MQETIPRSGRSSGGGNGNTLQYPFLENAMNRGAWQGTVHGVRKSRTQLSNRACTHTHTHTQPDLQLRAAAWFNGKLQWLSGVDLEETRRIPGTGGAWWAAVYGIAQSRTRLKWLSSSSRQFSIYSFFFFLFMYFPLIFIVFLKFYWTIIALQNFVVFCQTSTWISRRYTYIHSLWTSVPSPSPSHPSRLIQTLSFLSHTANSCWLSILHTVM